MDMNDEGKLLLTTDEWAKRLGETYGIGFERCYKIFHEKINDPKMDLDKRTLFKLNLLITTLQLNKQKVVNTTTKLIKEKFDE